MEPDSAVSMVSVRAGTALEAILGVLDRTQRTPPDRQDYSLGWFFYE